MTNEESPKGTDRGVRGMQEQRRIGGVEQLLTAVEVAEILRVSKQWVYRAARTGVFPCVSVGRNTRFRSADIQQFIDASQTESSSAREER